ncbi:PGAP1-like protein-domain-containing protein [Chlamydoabsidia padenii]|nr:PGAP1-like protein-domain-containing protein [Chlamydoabsidia padenii]
MPNNGPPSDSKQYVDIFLDSSTRHGDHSTTATGTTLSRTTASTITLTTDISGSNKNDTELYRRSNNNESTTPTTTSVKTVSGVAPPSSVAFPVVPMAVSNWYHLSTRWILILSFITMTSLGTLLIMLDSFTHYQKDTTACRESYMRPLYLKQDGFDSEMTRFAGKYSLYLYREKGVDLAEQPTGIPVLFIPGHAGSYKQIRSIAAESSYYYYQNYARNADTWDQGMRHLDFFTVDFNEEFSALHGQSLLEQAEYLNDAIDYILKLYPLARRWGPHQNTQLPDPTSVIILGHSMGGTVARTMFTLHNYQPGTINTVITLSTPHILPPAPFDWKISKIYDDIHSFWKSAYTNPQQQQQYSSLHSQYDQLATKTTISTTINSTDILKDVTLISIAGGNLDSMVCSDSTNVGTFLPSNHGFTVFSTTIPHVWTGADHISILSCNQLVKVLSKTLLNIVDARRGPQTKPMEQRIKIMEKAFLSGLEDRRGDGSDLELGELAFYDLAPNQSRFLLPGQRLILDKDDEHVTEKKMVFLPVYEGADALAILTSYPMGKHEPLDLLLCNKLEMRKKGTTRMGCRAATDEIVVPIPASTLHESSPSSGNTFTFASITFEEMQGYEFLAIMDRRGLGDFGSNFFIAEPYDFDTNTKYIDKSMLDIALGGLHVDLSPALFSNIRIPAIESSMLAYHVNVNGPQCSSTHFSPLLRQSIASMHESKFYVNIAGERAQIDMSVHGQTAFSATSPPIRSHPIQHHQHHQYDILIENNAHGLDINVWMDPTCNQPIRLDLTVDWYGSFGRIGFRNGIMLPTFTFIVVMVVWVAQLQCYFSTGIYPHFGQGMVCCLKSTFPLIASFLAMASIYQGWTDAEAYQLLGENRFVGEWWNRYVPNSFSYSNQARSSMAIVWNDVLAGRTDLFFWWLPVFGLVTSIGVVCFLWLTVSLFVQVCASMVTVFLRYYPSVSAPKTMKSPHYQYHLHHQQCHQHQLGSADDDHGLFWFIPYDKNNNLNRQRIERKIITTLILFSLVATCIPYQFVFLVAFLVHIITCTRSLIKLWTASPSQELKRNNRYHFLQSILLLFITLLPFNASILVVWIRNLSVHWFVPFSSDHSILAIAPFMIYVEMLTNQKVMLPRMLSRMWRWTTYCVYYAVVVYAFMYGIKYTHSLYFLSNGLTGWLLLVHFWYSPYGRQMYHLLMEFIRLYSFTKKKS